METRSPRRPIEVFARFLRLGLTAFGGPVAHLGYFRREFVERAHWLDDESFGELVALCSALPGPTSSQVGIVLGARRAGPIGGMLAWLAFTLPSAVALTLFGLMLRAAVAAPQAAPFANSRAWLGALAGLGGAAAGVVALATLGLARSLTPSARTRAIAAASFALALAVNRFAAQLQWLPLGLGGLAGIALLRDGTTLPGSRPLLAIPRRVGVAAVSLWLVLLVGLPAVAPPGGYLASFAAFFRAGSLVFGGGHVVLPFLQSVIAPDRVPARDFFAGYGAAQAVPGPLFTFAAFLGAVDRSTGAGWLGALVATLGIFAPSFLLLAAAIPLWGLLRSAPLAPAALGGINASVVGLLAAVLVDPIGRNLARAPLGFAIALFALAFLSRGAPAWLVVLGSAAVGAAAGMTTTVPSM